MKNVELTWEQNFDDGLVIRVKYVRRSFFGRDRLFIDDTEIKLPGVLKALMDGGIDVPFTYKGHNLNFVSNDYLIGIAENGVFVNTGINYYPKPKAGYVFYIFALICLIIPVLTLGGSIPSIIGFAGMGICFALQKISPAQAAVSFKKRMIAALLTAVICWSAAAVLYFTGTIRFTLISGPADKVVAGDYYEITLNDEFRKLDWDGYEYAATYKDAAFVVMSLPCSISDDNPSSAYSEALAYTELWCIDCDITVINTDRVIMEYSYGDEGDEYYIYTTLCKAGDMYYMFEFYCYKEDASDYKDLFQKWSDSIVIK